MYPRRPELHPRPILTFLGARRGPSCRFIDTVLASFYSRTTRNEATKNDGTRSSRHSGDAVAQVRRRRGFLSVCSNTLLPIASFLITHVRPLSLTCTPFFASQDLDFWRATVEMSECPRLGRRLYMRMPPILRRAGLFFLLQGAGLVTSLSFAAGAARHKTNFLRVPVECGSTIQVPG